MAFRLVEPLPPPVLDAVLAGGWYRSGQYLFTTNRLIMEVEEEIIISDVLWARVDMEGWQPTKRHKRLEATNRSFSLKYSDAVITPEIEGLYEIYLEHTALDSGPTAAAVLLGEGNDTNFFPGRMMTVRDGKQLIAVGYFDEGEQATAGILNFYHPDYRQYSLGLWLYFEEIRWTSKAGKRWYYPGYIATQYPKFDYKLLAGPERMTVRDPDTGVWIPYSESRHAAYHREKNSGGSDAASFES
jgi:arginine-tRNA-protein transferase